MCQVQQTISAFPNATLSEPKNHKVSTEIQRILKIHGYGDIAEQTENIANPSSWYYQTTGRDFAVAALSERFTFDPTACRMCGAHPECYHTHASHIVCSSCWDRFLTYAERGLLTPYEERFPEFFKMGGAA